jgi:TonB family protein
MRPIAGAAALAALGLFSAACRRADDPTVRLPTDAVERPVTPVDGPPVALNPNTPVEYPAPLLAQGIEGTVLLRLYVDEKGQLRRDSSRVAESSGYPALDSAALAAADRFRFAPALRRGAPVATSFVQPVQFRRPARSGRTP